MANLSKIEQVDVSSMQILPVVTKNASEKLVKITANLAKTTPDDIRPILVGRVNKLLYPINEFEIVSGLLKAGIKTTEAIIVDYPSMKELIVDHVRKNFQPHTIDPLRIREVIEYLIKNYNMGVSESCKMLWIDRRPDLLAAVRYTITDEAKAVMFEMIEEISKKMYSVVTPLLYVELLSKLREDVQVKAAQELKSIAMSTMSHEDKSFWPSGESIKIMLKIYPKKGDTSSVKKRIATVDSPNDLKKKKIDDEKNINAKTVKKAENFIKQDPHLIYVPMDGKDSDLIFDKKTGRVAKAKETDGVCSIKDDLGKPTHILSDRAGKFLGLDDDDDAIFEYEYSTLEKAKNALARSKTSGEKCVVLTKATLLRR